MARKEWEEPVIEAHKAAGDRATISRTARLAGIGRATIYRHADILQRLREMDRERNRERGKKSFARALRGLGMALALSLVVPSAWALSETQPLSLGAEGLTLSLRLQKWTEASGEWVDQATGGLTVNDLGDGDYSVDGLPLATGTDRYSLKVALSSDPNRGLYGYTYGAQPGVRVIWREEVEIPASPLVFKQGDTFGSVSLVVLRRLPAAACEPETTATFTMAPAAGGAAVVDAGAATITNCELDSTTATYGATFTYDWTSGDLDTAGQFVGEFEVCYEAGVCHTLPAANLRIRVTPQVGGGA